MGMIQLCCSTRDNDLPYPVGGLAVPIACCLTLSIGIPCSMKDLSQTDIRSASIESKVVLCNTARGAVADGSGRARGAASAMRQFTVERFG